MIVKRIYCEQNILIHVDAKIIQGTKDGRKEAMA